MVAGVGGSPGASPSQVPAPPVKGFFLRLAAKGAGELSRRHPESCRWGVGFPTANQLCMRSKAAMIVRAIRAWVGRGMEPPPQNGVLTGGCAQINMRIGVGRSPIASPSQVPAPPVKGFFLRPAGA